MQPQAARDVQPRTHATCWMTVHTWPSVQLPQTPDLRSVVLCKGGGSLRRHAVPCENVPATQQRGENVTGCSEPRATTRSLRVQSLQHLS